MPMGRYRSAVAQACQVVADVWLRLADGRHQLAHGQLALLEQLQDVETGWVIQDSEEACRCGPVAWRQKPGIHIWKAGNHEIIQKRPADFWKHRSKSNDDPAGK